jgi:SpoU rRNA methylase family enzyme
MLDLESVCRKHLRFDEMRHRMLLVVYSVTLADLPKSELAVNMSVILTDSGFDRDVVLVE